MPRYEIIGKDYYGNWTSDLGDDHRTYASEEEAREIAADLARVWAEDTHGKAAPLELDVREVKES